MYLCRHFFHADMAKPTLFTEYKERGRSHMWYVIQVRTGTEREIIRQCQTVIPKETLEKSFLPCFEEMKRYQGAWHKEQKLLFPGYVFLVAGSCEAKKIRRDLWKVKGALGLLEIDGELAVITDEEVDFLLALSGQEKMVRFSEGVIEQSKVRVYSGSLVGMEKYIRKIDRHKRRAVLEMPMFGEKQKMLVGLEIVERV